MNKKKINKFCRLRAFIYKYNKLKKKSKKTTRAAKENTEKQKKNRPELLKPSQMMSLLDHEKGIIRANYLRETFIRD